MKNVSFVKIFLWVVILGFFGLGSCKKNNDTPTGYYVKFKLDGIEKEYSEKTAASNLYAIFTTIGPRYQCAVEGGKLINGTGYEEGMGIIISSEAAIAANITYTDAIIVSLGTPQAFLVYTDSTGAQSSSAIAVSPNVQVIITQMDAGSVTGTFSGKIVSTADFTTTHTVTEGRFYLPQL